MENMKFYIQYLDYQPVGLRTHILNTNTFVWLQTLFTVGDLVAAVKQALPSKLGAIPVDELTIHYVVDGPAIAGDVLLTSIQEPVGSYNQPLVIKSSSRMAGQTQDTVMNIEGPNPEAVYKNLHQLISLDENKTVFSTQDSMENIALDQGILNLDIQGIDGVPNFLYSEKIYSDEKEIGIEMPVDRLCKIKGRSIAMIGVSGCGKTRTCYDLCRRSWGLYFDCSIDSDFTAMTEKLAQLAPAKRRTRIKQSLNTNLKD
ncbi:hypothetical protein RTP6_007677 [Batrachochytrium dendrobatidis]